MSKKNKSFSSKSLFDKQFNEPRPGVSTGLSGEQKSELMFAHSDPRKTATDKTNLAFAKSQHGFDPATAGITETPREKTKEDLGVVFSGPTPTSTVDDPPTSDINKEQPVPQDRLSPEEEKQRQEELDSEIEALKAESEKEIEGIRTKGKARIGSAKGFLAKIGALGRTVSGAPLDTNLGVLDFQQNLINDAIKEERQNLSEAISNAKAGSRESAEKRVEALNKIMKDNFDIALKLAQEDRAIDSRRKTE